MAVLPIKVDTFEDKWYHKKETKESFVLVWQMSNTLNDVMDTLNTYRDREYYDLSVVKGRATKLRNAGVRLKPLAAEGERMPPKGEPEHSVECLQRTADLAFALYQYCRTCQKNNT